MPSLCIFGLEFETIAVMFKSSSSNFGPQMPYLGIFGLEFERNIVIFEISTSNHHPRICLNEKFREKNKMLQFGTKNALFGYFYAGIFENYCHIWNKYLRICLIPKFCEETKMLKFGTKNVEYFWPKMRYLGIFGLEF